VQEVQLVLGKNGEEITLRPATPEDAHEIIDTVRSTSLERSYVLMETFGKDAASEREYITGMDREHNLLLVAVAKGKVVGGLAALQSDRGWRPHTAHILQIGLHLEKSYRGLGIGSQMLKYTVEWAREHGFTKVEANIFTTNKRSLHLFTNAGFVEEGTRRKQIRIGREYIDEVYMARFLD
jgi:RimJ/RimL family protein N-acetyltransferase